MRTSPRPRGRRAVAAIVSTLAALAVTGAVTAALPLAGTAVALAHPEADEAEQPGADRWVAAATGAVRPVQPVEDPIDAIVNGSPRVMAVYDGVELREPAADALAIGFHQAGGDHPGLTPVGTLLADDNPAGTGDVVADDAGPAFRVMPSRGRGGSATSAVDVALADDQVVRSVVTGTVVEVQDYRLYGRSRDVLVEIQPTGRPDLRVMLFHLEGPRVSVGDRVFAGYTPIADRARELPVTNQVDRFVDGGCPCRHIDVRVRRV